ncbi:MAG: gfo/Idh/MocA family oxidoreductase [Planctomycetia bacterium]|nr:gfo/Idh/MocA family oxidoreductase [Planctomycetia bacterium]
MTEPNTNPTRRDALQAVGTVTAGVLAGSIIPAVHAAGDEEIRIALIGCGGRGTGAAQNALQTKTGPTKLVTMVDVFKDKLENSHNSIKGGFKDQVDVPPGKRLIGFDKYKEAMDGLRKGDVVILTTPPAFRWVQFKYAIEKGLNVFMEKPVTVDGPSTRKMLELGVESVKKGLKVGVGLMCRHCENREQLHDKIKNGELGDIYLMRAYRMHGPIGTAHVAKKPEKMSELMYQIRNFHAFLWASGGAFSDFLIHNLDECCWMKDGWPVEARATGGRHYRDGKVDQNFDHYSVEYTFADGARLYLEGRTMDNCKQEFASYAHGTKGSAIISANSHASGRCPIYKDQKIRGSKPIWQAARETNPYQTEWDRLIDAIRNNKAHNEVERGAKASLACVMGRMAAHTGQVWTWEDTLNHEHEFAPTIDKLTIDGPAPLTANADGTYPIPTPGKNIKREY